MITVNCFAEANDGRRRQVGGSMDAEVEVDGRTARRDRNREAVLDPVLELFSDGNLTPSPDEVAQRSGVSLRSVYRYVAASDGLMSCAIERHSQRFTPICAIACSAGWLF